MNNPFNAFSIEIYLGEKRSGKTLSMVADTFNNMQKNKKENWGYKLYTNLNLNPKFFKFKRIMRKDFIKIFKEKIKFSKSIFLIDEAHLWFDCREHASKENKQSSYIFGQMGKRGNILRCCTHYPELLELRLRLYCEKKIFCTKGLVHDNIFYPIQNYNKEISKEEEEHLYIKNISIIRKMINFQFINVAEYEKYIKAKKYFNYYDTEEIILRNENKIK